MPQTILFGRQNFGKTPSSFQGFARHLTTGFLAPDFVVEAKGVSLEARRINGVQSRRQLTLLLSGRPPAAPILNILTGFSTSPTRFSNFIFDTYAYERSQKTQDGTGS